MKSARMEDPNVTYGRRCAPENEQHPEYSFVDHVIESGEYDNMTDDEWEKLLATRFGRSGPGAVGSGETRPTEKSNGGTEL